MYLNEKYADRRMASFVLNRRQEQIIVKMQKNNLQTY